MLSLGLMSNMVERKVFIPTEKLSLPPVCPSPDIAAVIYLLGPKLPIEAAQIMVVKCRNARCPIDLCRYKKNGSF